MTRRSTIRRPFPLSLALALTVLFGTLLLSSAAVAQPCLMLVPELDQAVPPESLPQGEITLEGFGFQFGVCLLSVTFGSASSPSTQFIDAFQMTVTVPDVSPGVYPIQVTTVGGESNTISFTVLGLEPDWVRGDCNQDGAYNIADAVTILAALFDAGTVVPNCVDACDMNDDGSFDISDPIFGLANLFSSGAPPSAPHPGCGTDPTADSLDCEEFTACP